MRLLQKPFLTAKSVHLPLRAAQGWHPFGIGEWLSLSFLFILHLSSFIFSYPTTFSNCVIFASPVSPFTAITSTRQVWNSFDGAQK
jgi:hypothetical protein